MVFSDSMDRLFETMKNPLRREIFDYLSENSRSNLSEIYAGVHQSYERRFEGPLDIESELEGMPYVAKRFGKTDSPEDHNSVYETMHVAERSVEAAEIAMEGSIYYDPGELVDGFEALAELDMETLHQVLEDVAENAREK